MFSKLLVLPFLGGFAWGLDPNTALEGLNPPHPLKVEFQGGISRLPEEKQQEVLRVLRIALQWTRDLAPVEGPHFFSPDPSHSYFNDRSFRIVLTDEDKVTTEGHATHQLSGDYDAESLALISIQNGKPVHEKLAAVLRIDRVFLDKEGNYRPLGFYHALNALLKQIYGFWQEHLDTPLETLRKLAESKPQYLENRIARRSVKLFENLVDDSSILKKKNGGELLGRFFSAWFQESVQISERSPSGANNPLALPFSLHWGKSTLDSLTAEQLEIFHSTLMRAMHLVYSIPLQEPDIFRHKGKKDVLNRKSLEVYVMDSRDLPTRALVQMPYVVDAVEWMPSETFCLANEKKTFQRFVTTFWANQIFYEGNGVPRPDRLARMALAMAAEFYGGVQEYLYEPVSKMVPLSPMGFVLLRARVLKKGIEFAEVLQKHRLWETLSDEEKKGLLAVKSEYVTQEHLTSCAVKLGRRTTKGSPAPE